MAGEYAHTYCKAELHFVFSSHDFHFFSLIIIKEKGISAEIGTKKAIKEVLSYPALKYGDSWANFIEFEDKKHRRLDWPALINVI